MYASTNAAVFFGITVLFAISYQYVPEYEPPPPPRDPPSRSNYYRDSQARHNSEYSNSSTRLWACGRRMVLYMRWPDFFHKKNQSDLWFDRLVYIHHEGNYDFVIREHTDYPRLYNDSIWTRNLTDLSVTVNGIIFEDDRILTSFNPFRQIIKYAFKRQFTHVCVLNERQVRFVFNDTTFFRTKYYSIACARQVVPLEETYDMPANLWHGKANRRDFERQHSPIHDLMVIRIEGFIPNMTKNNYDIEFLKKQEGKDFYVHGPQKTILAKKGDVMGSDFTFAMMGHVFWDPAQAPIELTVENTKLEKMKDQGKRMRDTYVGRYDKSENVLVDCDEWIPREWGYFICVLNKQGLRRLASGAALYSRKLLFGIGSFTLFKGNESILVFTDVRPYESVITDKDGPCTTVDQFIKTTKKAGRSQGKPRSTQNKKQTKNGK